jgi:hypothetical protein
MTTEPEIKNFLYVLIFRYHFFLLQAQWHPSKITLKLTRISSIYRKSIEMNKDLYKCFPAQP